MRGEELVDVGASVSAISSFFARPQAKKKSREAASPAVSRGAQPRSCGSMSA